MAPAAFAQMPDMSIKEHYKAEIWVDPDGCEHWVMDDGAEGYMSPNVDASGIPMCNGSRGNLCGRIDADQFFATDKYTITSEHRSRLMQFFRDNINENFIIEGHTDSRASHAYNQRLSVNRAKAVASIARKVGANVVEVRGKGETSPIATNSTSVGMAKNRRVDILCTQ